MKTILFLILSGIGFCALSQTPTMPWQKTIGGADYDNGIAVIEEPNGDFVVCASSSSNISGEKTEMSFGDEDIWFFKMMPDGTILWQITVGGSGYDTPVSMVKTNDGGFIMVGTSSSPISGNKSSLHYGETDVWVVKLSNTGQLLWQESYGGSGFDSGSEILLMEDGTFFILASSNSGIEGNKTIDTKGESDIWLIHLAQNGSILSQYGYGGSDIDNARGVSKYGNKLIISGNSLSNISGDKLQNSFGSSDYWVLIVDTMGNLLNSNTIGGDGFDFNRDLSVNNTGEIVLFGQSQSGVSGNKTSGNFGWDDYWVVKLDSNLNIIWDDSYGGDSSEQWTYTTINFSANNLTLIGGVSDSDISGNKTLGSFGFGDIWILGLDSTGGKTFEFVAGGSNTDGISNMIESNNSTIVGVGGSRSEVTGNKTEPSRGESDVWLFELDFNVGMEKVYSDNTLQAFPIPATTVLNFAIPMKGEETQITLVDITGKVVYSGTNSFGDHEQIDVSNFTPGVYVLNVISDKFQYTRKVVIE